MFQPLCHFLTLFHPLIKNVFQVPKKEYSDVPWVREQNRASQVGLVVSVAAEGMTGFKDALSWKERCGGARTFLQAAFFCTLHTSHIKGVIQQYTVIYSDIQWYTVIYSDTTQVDKDLLQMPTAQEILRCFPVATCFSLSQTFTIMAYSSGATLPCQNFMNSTWQFVILWLLHVYYVLWGIRACIFIPMFLPNSAYLRSVMCLFWRSLQTFRLRHDTIFACVRSVGWRTRPLAALQLWVFGCFQNVLNVCS